jgi:dipeptidyl aminopeptidase/acylaminoacyl peptidase
MRAALAHWSPDGQQIAFSGAVLGKPWQIFLISKDGGSPQLVAAEEVQETDPTWSPEGGSLAFGHQDLLAQPEHTFIELFDFRQGRKNPHASGECARKAAATRARKKEEAALTQPVQVQEPPAPEPQVKATPKPHP